MKLNGHYRNKFLSTLWLLKTHSCEDNPLSTQEIIAELKDRNVNIDRRTLKCEIDMMKEYGVNIVITKKSHQLAYYIPEDLFNQRELNMLIGAIRAASFITKEKTDSLVKKLTDMANEKEVDVTDSELVCYNVIKQNSFELFDNIITLQKCIDRKKQASFFYFEHDEKANKIYKYNKRIYVVDPVALVFNEGFYYLIAYNRNQKQIRTYRVDRQDNIKMEDADVNNQLAKEFFDEYLPIEKGIKHEADIKDIIQMYSKQAFKMYGGIAHNISLEFPKYLLDPVYDKFGFVDELGKKHKISYDEETDLCLINVHVQISPTLWGWIAQFGGEMKVKGPKKCIKDYKEFCQRLLNGLE